jgi:hypothetical protein
LLSQLTSAQLSEWEAYDRLDPIGSWRQDYNYAQIASIITNIVNSIYCKEGSKPELTTVVDFMPIWDKEERKRIERKRNTEDQKRQSVEEIKSTLMAFAKVHNERVAKKGIQPIKRKS